MRAEIRKFKNYDEEIIFCKDILSIIDEKNILLLGNSRFINDILSTNKGNSKNINKSGRANKTKNKREKSQFDKYVYALVEEDSIKELDNYKGKIEAIAYILHNEEDNHILNFVGSINNNQSDLCKNCQNCSNESNDFDEEVSKVLDQYLDILDYVDPDNYDSKKELLYELADSFYTMGMIMTKTQMMEDLTDSVQDDIKYLQDDSRQ